MTPGTEALPAEGSWEWPFSRADLTAGLRRITGDTTLQVTSTQPLTIAHRRPSIGRLRGMLVQFDGADGPQDMRLVVKEPRGATRTGLAGAGRREVGVYQMLAPQLPLKTPQLIAGSANGDWLILEELRPIIESARWGREHYERAISGLTVLHDRFWGLGEDLNAFPWLSRPLETDYEVHVTAAAHAIERIVELGHPEPLANAPERMRILAQLTTQADRIVSPLRDVPNTLLHGDYWPGNIAVTEDGEQVVYDWQLSAVGPAILDLLVFVNKSEWWFDELPLEPAEMVGLYRQQLARRTGSAWEPDHWALLWDHALMWRFVQEWVDLLAASPDPILETRAEQLDQVWLDPVAAAVERRLTDS